MGYRLGNFDLSVIATSTMSDAAVQGIIDAGIWPGLPPTVAEFRAGVTPGAAPGAETAYSDGPLTAATVASSVTQPTWVFVLLGLLLLSGAMIGGKGRSR